jgi:hypothetical protein
MRNKKVGTIKENKVNDNIKKYKLLKKSVC